MGRLPILPLAVCAALLGCAEAQVDRTTGPGDGGDDEALVGRSGATDAWHLPDVGAPFDAARSPFADLGVDDPLDGAPGPDPDPDAGLPGFDAGRPPPIGRDAAPGPVPREDAAPPACQAETCNGLDDDCDGVIDDHGACGPYVQTSCRLFLGWADNLRGPPGVAASWGGCPPAERAYDGDVRCTSTRRDGRFTQLDFDGNVDENDQLGVAFRCEDPAHLELAAWVQSHCALYLGHADDRGGAPDGSRTWGACPDAPVSNAGLRCTSTGRDGQFRPLVLTGDVDDNDQLAVAFICTDPADPPRADAVAASVEVFLGHADDNDGPGDGAEAWGPCPAQSAGEAGGQRCVGTRGDQGFHPMTLDGDVDDNDDLGLALRARSVP